MLLRRNQFVPYVPLLNEHLAVDESSGLVAVVRERGCVEIYSVGLNFTLVNRFTVSEPSVEAICFLKTTTTLAPVDHVHGIPEDLKREKIILDNQLTSQYSLLAVASVDGSIRLISPRTGTVSATCDSMGGGPIWCMAPSGFFKLLIGCEDGSVRELEMANDGLSFVSKTLIVDRAPEGRPLLISYDPISHQTAVALDNLTVRIIDNKTKQVTTSRFEQAATTLAWSLDGKVLFVGHADGSLSIVNPRVGHVRQRMRHHLAPLKSICVMPDSTVYAAGVDYRCLQVVKNNESNFSKSCQRRVCHNDVIGMARYGQLVIQCCVDGSLRLFNHLRFGDKDCDRVISGLPNRPSIATSDDYLVANLHDKVMIWSHGQEEPLFMAELLANDCLILDMVVSRSNQIAVQYPRSCHVFKFDGLAFALVKKVKQPFARISFAQDSLVSCHHTSNGIAIIVDGEKKIDLETNAFIITMATSDTHTAISLSNSSVVFFDHKTFEHKIIELPSVIICLLLKDQTLYAYTITHQCFQVDVVSGNNSEMMVPRVFAKQYDVVRGLIFDPNTEALYAWSEFGICKIGDENDRMCDAKGSGPFKCLIHASFIRGGEMVTVERPWQHVMPHLPPAFIPPKFGQQ